MVHVIIPTPEQARQMELAGTYHHFNERLNQRYNLNLSLEEYVETCKNPIKTLKKERHKLIGIIKIRGVEVLVVRMRYKKRRLITALPYHNIYNLKN